MDRLSCEFGYYKIKREKLCKLSPQEVLDSLVGVTHNYTLYKLPRTHSPQLPLGADVQQTCVEQCFQPPL